MVCLEGHAGQHTQGGDEGLAGGGQELESRITRDPPTDVYGPDFPSETFRVPKEKEIARFGEYRTRRLVLEAWERLYHEGVLK